MTKIAILGLAGSGKDTFAEMLLKSMTQLGQDFCIDRYASLLKEAARQVFGSDFDNRDVKEVELFVTPELHDKMVDATDYLQLKLGLDPFDFTVWNDRCVRFLDNHTWMSPRKFQQIVGTEVGRAVRSSIWVDYLKQKEGNLIVADCRFRNELLDWNIFINRADIPKGDVHPSEQFAVDLIEQRAARSFSYSTTIDFTVDNLYDLDTLQNKAHTIAKLIMQG